MPKTQIQSPVAKQKRNRRRRNWHGAIRRVCGLILVVDLALLVFANPRLQVTHVKINGLQTLSTQQVFDEARVPARTNIFWMAVHQPFAARLAHDSVIDHVRRTIILPRTLVLNVTERQPYAVLAAADVSGTQTYWVLDRKGVPFRTFDSPPTGLPLLEWQGAAPALTLGQPLTDARLTDAYALLALVRNAPSLAVQKIEVDQYANLCLNSRGNLRILLGQPQALPEKIALAQAALGSGDGFAGRVACLDLSCPQQPVYTPRPEASLASNAERPGTYGQ